MYIDHSTHIFIYFYKEEMTEDSLNLKGKNSYYRFDYFKYYFERFHSRLPQGRKLNLY